MLTLIQIMHHMRTRLEYTFEEIDEHFRAVEAGELTLEELLDICGVAVSTTGLALAKEKLPRWEAALYCVQLQLSDN
jgi:hypothetical protein